MSLSPHEHVRHMLDEIDYFLGKANGMGMDPFLRDETLKRAFVRSLEVIGEAARTTRTITPPPEVFPGGGACVCFSRSV